MSPKFLGNTIWKHEWRKLKKTENWLFPKTMRFGRLFFKRKNKNSSWHFRKQGVLGIVSRTAVSGKWVPNTISVNFHFPWNENRKQNLETTTKPPKHVSSSSSIPIQEIPLFLQLIFGVTLINLHKRMYHGYTADVITQPTPYLLLNCEKVALDAFGD